MTNCKSLEDIEKELIRLKQTYPFLSNQEKLTKLNILKKDLFRIILSISNSEKDKAIGVSTQKIVELLKEFSFS